MPKKSRFDQSAYLTSDMLVARLHNRYPAKEYAFFTQAASNTGGPADRTADALALALWPSRGLTLTGFEIKVSRSDWIRELRNPEKAERIAKYCDYWFIVANIDIVPPQELPPNWGLMVPNKDGSGLLTQQAAQKLKPVPLDRDFMAALMRNVGDTMVPRSTLSEQIEIARREGIKKGEQSVGDVRELERLRTFETMVETFEHASGLSLRLADAWDGQTAKTVGDAVKAILRGADDMKWRMDALGQIEKVAGELVSLCRDQVKTLKAAHAQLTSADAVK